LSTAVNLAGKHRGFAFVEFELEEDSNAAVDNMDESELLGRTIRVNHAKPKQLNEASSKPVWTDENWLSKFGRGGGEGVNGKLRILRNTSSGSSGRLARKPLGCRLPGMSSAMNKHEYNT
jgi:peptidyl-prolyl isomerase E (cyclophilin E)